MKNYTTFLEESKVTSLSSEQAKLIEDAKGIFPYRSTSITQEGSNLVLTLTVSPPVKLFPVDLKHLAGVIKSIAFKDKEVKITFK